MDEREFKQLIDKYIKGECSPEERDFLDKSLDAARYTSQHRSVEVFEGEVQQRIWSKIRAKTIEETIAQEEQQPRPSSFLNIYKIAAILAGIAVGSVALWMSLRNVNNGDQLVYSNDQIVLRSGANAHEIQTGEFGQITNDDGKVIASQEGDVIVYKANVVNELVYNEIKVPRGKRIQLRLSDGTSVHLNANSVFKFPVNFLENEDRQVFLTGEAYFEVANDAAHPFLLDANDMRVRVLGTHFNVSSYAGSISNAVLLEGSVAIQERRGDALAGQVQTLTAGQKASMLSGSIEIEEVDVENYVGWMNGALIFDHELFSEIVKKIERRYNVKIEVHNESLNALRFKGKFQEESIIDLLDTFEESAGFHYTISDNKVIIQ